MRHTDISAPGAEFFGHKRVYGNQPSGSSYLGPNGYGWWTYQTPFVQSVGGSAVAVTFDADQTYWFDQAGGAYTPRYSFLNVSLTAGPAAGTLTFVKTQGTGMEVTVFNGLDASVNSGMFVSHTDARGVQTTIASQTGSQINELRRTFTLAGVTTVESLQYAYVGSGAAAGLLASVSYRRMVGGGDWTPVSQAIFAYYDTGDANGNAGDLKTASQQLPDGAGGWNTVAVRYYRYYLPGTIKGFAHGLKLHLDAEAHRLVLNAGIDVDTASDATMVAYADHYFEYDPSGRQVTKEISAVCDSCPGGGTTTDLFEYTNNPRHPADGYNTWKVKAVQTLPDGSQVVVYTNYAGVPMLHVNIDPSGSNRWATFNRYGADGQVIWKAHPSAVALPTSLDMLEQYDDLLNYDAGTQKYQYLNDNAGLIEVTEYYSFTDPTQGAVLGKASAQGVQQGQLGTVVLQRAFTYGSNTDADGNIVNPVATQVEYPNAGNTTVQITTSYSYTWYAGTNQLQQKTTTLPAVATSQNGSGASATIVEEYDHNGNLTSRTDERGTVTAYSYDTFLGKVTRQVLNYQSTGSDPGVNVTTDFSYDVQGRLTQTLGPSHTAVVDGAATTVRKATWYVYVLSAQPTSGTWDVDQTWSGTGYATGTDPSYAYTLVDPISIAKLDKDGRSTDQITSRRTGGSGALSPTDTFAQTDWQSWSSTQYDAQHRTISQRTYFLIPTSGTGTAGTHYGETDYGYDALERRNRVVTPGGTITRTVWTCPQRVAFVWVGTDDTGATDSNPAGSGSPNNMVLVAENQYDGGSDGGDGNLTQVTQYASATDTRATAYGYDFRDRRTSMTDALNSYTVYTYDNLDRLSQTQRYASPGGTLIAQSATGYDDCGRVYRQITYAVDPATGTVGNALTGNSWYDASGNLLQQINPGDGYVFSKSSYNAVGWVTATYRGYNASGASYNQAGTVINDTIVEQTQNTYDEAGNLVSQATFQRLNDTPSSGSGSTGPLTAGAQPAARVSYTAIWFDGIDRSTATANYGAAASFSRPDTPPSSSDVVLVTGTSYDDAGRVSAVTIPMGYVTQTSYDAAGRVTQTVEDYGTGAGNLNRTTQHTYTLDNLIATLTAVNSNAGNQTTTYTHGTSLSTSGVARNDLLLSVTYPDSAGGSDVVSYTYNRQGQKATLTDQRGTVRTLHYDKLGRLTDDCVTTVGGNTDNAVLRVSRTYEARGMVQMFTSYNNAVPGNGTVINQVQLSYNDFAQLVQEYQEHGGAATGSSASVQYAYGTEASNFNQNRSTGLTYPNGRAITYDYGTSGAMDDLLNRITALQDGTTDLVQYTYLGAGTVIRVTYPQPSVWLDLWGGTSGAFNGLDLFGRVIDQRWQNNVGSTPADIDRFQYGYNQNSNRRYKANVAGTLVVSGGLDEYYAYDRLNRLTQMQRGMLNSTRTGIAGTPSREMDWTLDAAGNWLRSVTLTAGTTDLNQSRTSNSVNEITAISDSAGPAWATPAYDQAGNATTMPQVADPAHGFTVTYDAWNRLVQVSAGGTIVVRYQYDGRNRRAVKLTYAGGTISETRHFYFTNQWQDIEERVDASAMMDKQYVWGVRYVDDLVCRDDAAPRRLYACQDANYNVTAIADASGTVQERFMYDPYGGDTVLNGIWAATTDSYAWACKFTGQQSDPATTIYDYRHRSYSPNIGQFYQRDPVGYRSGLNLYEYVRSQANDHVDSDGRTAESCVCGVDVTDNMRRLEQRFNDNLPKNAVKRKAVLDSAVSIRGWDIFELAWYKGMFSQKGCGTGKCANTVQVNGRCYHSEQVNYYLWGMIYRARWLDAHGATAENPLTGQDLGSTAWDLAAQDLVLLYRTTYGLGTTFQGSPDWEYSGRLLWTRAGFRSVGLYSEGPGEREMQSTFGPQESAIKGCNHCDTSLAGSLTVNLGVPPNKISFSI